MYTCVHFRWCNATCSTTEQSWVTNSNRCVHSHCMKTCLLMNRCHHCIVLVHICHILQYMYSFVEQQPGTVAVFQRAEAGRRGVHIHMHVSYQSLSLQSFLIIMYTQEYTHTHTQNHIAIYNIHVCAYAPRVFCIIAWFIYPRKCWVVLSQRRSIWQRCSFSTCYDCVYNDAYCIYK